PGRFAPGSPSPASGEGKAIMCAEAVPWRCHRSLISDALIVRGVEVRHVTSRSKPERHTLTLFARVQGGRITYPPPDTLPLCGEWARNRCASCASRCVKFSPSRLLP